MRRRDFLIGLVAAGLCAAPALARGVVDSIKRQLRDLGFRSIVEKRTLLGRTRITATREDGLREIIVNPSTGEILRDLWMPSDGTEVDVVISDRPPQTDDKDDDGDDNSGPGGGDGDNSGPGGGGEGEGGGGGESGG